MGSLVKFFVLRRDVLSNISVALCAGSYVGGVMFNVLGAGDNWRNAIAGLCLVMFFAFWAFVFKEVKNG